MIKGLLFQQHHQQQAQTMEENMSNLTSASGEASACSGNRTDQLTANYSGQQYFSAPQPQNQPPKKKRNLPGNPDPDSEVIALSPKTLLATNRFICEICNKGFQRDQNLQLHRRGHNLPWKLKQRPKQEVIRKKVYVCPEASCVHHDPSRALGDLTGIKKHFCRKHGEKKWKCDKCSKRYAVQSDWKAHSKTCGTREYRCDCGTLFSRRDSFITHRAFCDALAEESARAITSNPVLVTNQQQPAASSISHLNFQTHFNPLDIHSFSLKKEQQNSSFIRSEIPPWLACPGPPQIDLSSSSSCIFPARLDQELSQPLDQNLNPNPNLGPTILPPFHSTPSPHMSATALLQKAAQMGSTMSSNADHLPSQIRPHAQDHVSDSASNTSCNFGLNLSSSREDHQMASAGFPHGLPTYRNKVAVPSVSPATTTRAAAVAIAPSGVPSSLVHGLMNSFSSAASGFQGSSFEDVFGGILHPKKDENLSDTLSRAAATEAAAATTTTAAGGTGGSEGMTRDFLGLRAFSHSDFLNLAGYSNCMNTAQSPQNQIQKPWQG